MSLAEEQMVEAEQKEPFNYGWIWTLLAGMAVVFFGGTIFVLTSGRFSAAEIQTIATVAAFISLLWGVVTNF